MAHSLGNMLVSSAIQDHEAPVDVYFMFNSAVPAEAYDTDAPTYDFSIEDVPEGLIHDDWDAYPPKSYAALWYRHFLPHEGFVPKEGDDARAQLTWKGRFKDVIKNRGVEVYNYYSAGSGSESGDEVLELSPSTPSPITGMLDSLGRYAWHKQEAYKGRVAKTGGIIMMNTDIMGWGFEKNRKDEIREPEKAFDLSDEELRTNPLFLHNPPLIFGADASAILAQRDHLLAQGIPALSQATGRVEITPISREDQYDLQRYMANTTFKGVQRGGASGRDSTARWLHSDIKDLAYPLSQAFFHRVITQGRLK